MVYSIELLVLLTVMLQACMHMRYSIQSALFNSEKNIYIYIYIYLFIYLFIFQNVDWMFRIYKRIRWRQLLARTIDDVDECSMVSSHCTTYLFGTMKILHAYAHFQQRQSASMSVTAVYKVCMHSNLCVCNCVCLLISRICILCAFGGC